jgi:hypothetical protein
MRILRFGFVCAGVVAVLALSVLADDAPLRSWGGIIELHLDAAVPAPAKIQSVRDVQFSQYTFTLFPNGGAGGSGTIAAPDGSDRPIRVHPSAEGARAGDSLPSFQLVRVTFQQFPYIPGKWLAIVNGVLYAGNQSSDCTGVVQIFKMEGGQLIVTDQITYDCRGGTSTHYDIRKRRLEVNSSRFAAGDDKCCPSFSDHVAFKVDAVLKSKHDFVRLKPTDIHVE